MNVLPFVKRYTESGRVCLPIPAGTKKTTTKGWSDPAQHDFLIGDDDNVAWRLDGLCDVDLDCPEAVVMAARLLPPTPCRSGRPSANAPTHWFYHAPDAAYEKFDDPAGGTLLELRTGSGHYTLVPPSRLPAARGAPEEETRWYAEGVPPEPTWAVLRRRGALLASASLLARALGPNGYGHDARIELAGLLLRLGVTVDEAVDLGVALSRPTQNTEVDDVAVATRSTAKRLETAGARTKGGPALAKRIDAIAGGGRGPAVIKAVTRWLKGEEDLEDVRIEGIPPLTETGDAEKFAELNAEGVRYDYRRGGWLLYTGHRWAPQTDGEIDRLALAAIRVRQIEALGVGNDDARRACLKWALGGEARARRTNLLELAHSVRPLSDTGDKWDLDPWLLCTPSGVVDLQTGELREGAPEDRLTMMTRAPYDPEATCPLWDETVAQVFDGDEELIAYFDRFVGYSLTGDTREEALVVAWGEGANGKGTLMNTVGYALGDYTDDLPFSTFEMSSRAAIPNDLAKIVGKRFVTSSETGEAQRLNEARVKALTGRDPITARFLHHEFFTFEPVAKFWLATNHKPDVQDDSVGFWRRIHLLPFEQSFAGREDRTLKNRLRLEAAGVLARAVRGCLAWQRGGLAPPEAVLAASREWREESDVLSPFLGDCCVVVPGARVRAGVLFLAYDRWAKEHGVRDRLSQKAFGQRMQKLFKMDDVNKQTTYVGVGIRDDSREGDL